MDRRPLRLRTSRGLGSVELAISAIFLAVMTVLAVDLCVLMLGNQVLDKAARDAARAAAAQRDLNTAIKAAKAALTLHKTDGTYVSQPELTSSTAPDFVYNDYSGTPFGQPIPPGNPNAGSLAGNATVTVTSTVKVKLPASLSLFGVTLQGQDLLNGNMKFVRTYTFPIVRQSLNKEFT
jgi:Flp pilus assembly protein TadG